MYCEPQRNHSTMKKYDTHSKIGKTNIEKKKTSVFLWQILKLRQKKVAYIRLILKFKFVRSDLYVSVSSIKQLVG